MLRAWQPRLVCIAFVVLPMGLLRVAGVTSAHLAGVEAAPRPAQVRQICQSGLLMSPGCIANISGSGTPPLKEPEGIAVNASGDVFVADTGNSLVREIKAGTRTLTTVAGGGSDDVADGGPPTGAALENPAGVAVDAQGDLFIADTGDHRVLEVSADLHRITTVAGDSGDGNTTDREPSGPALGAGMDPKGLAVDGAGNVYIVDGTEVREISAASPRTITTVAGNNRDDAGGVSCEPGQCAGVPALQAKLYGPAGLALDTAGNLYIADYNNLRVRKVAAAAPRLMSVVAGSGDGGYGGDCGPATASAALLYAPRDVAVDRQGDLYVTADDVVRMVDPTGRLRTVAGSAGTKVTYPCDPHDAATGFAFDNLWGIALDGAGNLYLTDNNTNQVLEVAAPAVAGPPAATPTRVATAIATPTSTQSAQTPVAQLDDVVLSIYPVPETIVTGDNMPVTVYAVPGSKVALDMELVTSGDQVLYAATTTVVVGPSGSASASIPVSFDPHGSEQFTAVIRATTTRGMDVRRFDVTIVTSP